MSALWKNISGVENYQLTRGESVSEVSSGKPLLQL